MAPQSPEHRVDRLFADRADSLGRLNTAELRAAVRAFSGGCGGSRARRLCAWTSRALLCLLAAAVAAATLGSELVAGGYATQSTEWLAATDLAVQKFLRRVSHTFRLYDWEAVRGIGSCLIPNPFSREAPLCCGCRRPKVARLPVDSGNLTATARFIDSLYNRAVSPFLLTGQPAEVRVDFARLARFVSGQHRPDFERGANNFRTLAAEATAEPAVRRFADLFPTATEPRTEPPPGQLLMWSFSHLSAFRALRRLVPRPAFFGQRTERILPTSLLIAGRRWLPRSAAADAGRFRSAGDFPGRRALAYALPLDGRLTVRLAPKAACCGSDGAGSASEPDDPTEVTLEPGRVLFFPTDCYELLVGPAPDGSDGPALVHIGFLFNGAHQARRRS